MYSVAPAKKYIRLLIFSVDVQLQTFVNMTVDIGSLCDRCRVVAKTVRSTLHF